MARDVARDARCCFLGGFSRAQKCEGAGGGGGGGGGGVRNMWSVLLFPHTHTPNSSAFFGGLNVAFLLSSSQFSCEASRPKLGKLRSTLGLPLSSAIAHDIASQAPNGQFFRKGGGAGRVKNSSPPKSYVAKPH